VAVYTDRLTQTFSDTGFFGHPRGLSTLFFVEMWERFSYYGMRALLILFMTASTATGGLGMGVAEAGAIYGIYTSSVYLLSLPGGWLADTFLGQRRAVLLGGILIASGQFLLAAPMMATFYAGLAVVCLGTGLLKPNASTIVGQLYKPGDPRRDSGFSIFYIGINVGAFIAPLVCGYLRVSIGWRIAFAAAGAGMLIGLIQFTLGAKNLGDAGLRPAVAVPTRKDYTKLKLLIALILLVFAAMAFGRVSAELFANVLGVVLLLIFFVVFGFMFLAGDWTRTERNRLIVIALLVIAAALFWSSFEQAGSTLNLFAARNTNNQLFGISFTPEVYQSLNSMFMILGLAQFFAWLWIALGPRDPAPPWKFALGLILVGLGFAVLIPASQIADAGRLVSPWWLVSTYFLHTVGELCLSPVGLSAMTKLAPARVAGFMMGVWFLSNAMGNYLGGRLASFYESFPISTLFGAVAIFSIGFGVLMALIAKPLTKMMEGAK
jgi:POT family proton-dependent oligopeptide transporter